MIPVEPDYDLINMIVVIRETMFKGGESKARASIIDKLDELIIKELNPTQTTEQ